MTEQRNNQQNEETITEGIKNTAGAAFHAVHNALEATENAAMSAVEKTKDTINNLRDDNQNQGNQ